MTDKLASATAAGTVVAAPPSGNRIVIKAIHISGSTAVSLGDGTTVFASNGGALNFSGIEIDMAPATALTFAGTGSVTVVYRIRRTGA